MKELRPGGKELTLNALSFCPVKQSTRILDVGCGNGESLVLIREKYACFTVGIEPDDERRHRALSVNPGVKICAATAENIPFANQSFDIVLTECTASLFEHPMIAFAEIGRVLRPGGQLILNDVYAKNVGVPLGTGMLRHLYTREEFITFLAAANCAVRYEEDYGDMLATMMGQLILDFGAAEAYRMIGLDRCALKSAGAGYMLMIAEKEKP